MFTQHTAFIPTAYTVTGVLANTGVEVAKCSNIPDKNTYTNWQAATFGTAINIIGYDWKTFNGTSYDIKDSLLYFVKPANGDIWKIIFTGFGGSANGNYILSKEKLYTATSVAEVNGKTAASVALYPNPAKDQTVNIIYSFEITGTSAQVLVQDITGKTVWVDNLDVQKGLHQYHLPAQTLHSGLYIVTVASSNIATQQKLIIQ